ncbi:MAG: hypothetical protein QNJ18_13585 [Xenococcaceae cyanobacterium MO_167.B52]|nr:hypothetical protein [Xenococcaceae cyanobacterium MO_167.B52]
MLHRKELGTILYVSASNESKQTTIMSEAWDKQLDQAAIAANDQEIYDLIE